MAIISRTPRIRLPRSKYIWDLSEWFGHLGLGTLMVVLCIKNSRTTSYDPFHLIYKIIFVLRFLFEMIFLLTLTVHQDWWQQPYAVCKFRYMFRFSFDFLCWFGFELGMFSNHSVCAWDLNSDSKINILFAFGHRLGIINFLLHSANIINLSNYDAITFNMKHISLEFILVTCFVPNLT